MLQLSVLLVTLLSFVYGDQLTYSADGSGDIASISFSWSNPDSRSPDTELTGPSSTADAVLVTDGLANTEIPLEDPSGAYAWGKSDGTTVGLVGTFTVDSLNLGSGDKYWLITSMSISFRGTVADCWTAKSTAGATITAYPSNSAAIVVMDESLYDGVVTFTSTISAPGIKSNGGAITFNIESNSYCTETEMYLIDILIDGEIVKTVEPTTSPTKNPSPEPTMAPTSECKGQVTWGDPHMYLMATVNDLKFNYQGLGWFYYFFPCDIDRDYENWPFFILSHHEVCYWKGNPKGCIDGNMLIINTKPNPWKISFRNKDIDVIVGSGGSVTQSKINKVDFTDYKKGKPYIISYDDGQDVAQSGTIEIYIKSGTANVILKNVAYHDYPRTCERGTLFNSDCGDYKCSGKVVALTAQGTTTTISCPTCFRNLACGLMGKYVRGDCTKKDLKDSSSACYDIFQTPEGEHFQPPVSDTQYVPFADTWLKEDVDTILAGKGLTVIDFEGSHDGLRKKEIFDARDASLYEGDCKNNIEQISIYNETCKEHTIDKYVVCCKELGYCHELWSSCIEDMCSCFMDDEDGNRLMTEDDCLQVIVHDAMNVTCSNDNAWPTNAPTTAPTSGPTPAPSASPTASFLIPREKRTKVGELIGIYSIFVILFLVIAIGAYVYYRKKNSIKVYVPNDEEIQLENETGTMIDEEN